MKTGNLVIAGMLWLASLNAHAALNVLACEPEWASLAQELGGEKINATSATTALQDPHRIEARPSLIAKARNADLIVCSGAELEVGWLPLLLSQSGNARIQPGGPGYLEASQVVARLEIPKIIDRSQGDVHPAGNPHVHLDPRNIARVADALTERLVSLDAPNAVFFRARGVVFRERWTQAIAAWEKRAAALKGLPVVVYHRDLSYLIAWLGLREAGSLEPKPGIPPSTGYLADLLARLQQSPAKVIAYSAYNSPKAAEWLAERAKIPALQLPYTVGGSEHAKDLFGLFDDTIDRLAGVVR